MTDIDVSRLAASGRAGEPTELAGRARRFGVWYYAETSLRSMRAYLWTVVAVGVGQPLFYLVALGVGLGALVSANGQTVDGVSYLVFVAPAVMVATIVAAASGELTYPVMAGFRWRRTYYGPAATPVTPAQISLGHLLAVTLRFVAQAIVFWLFMLAFGATSSPWSWLTVPIAALSAVAFGAPLQAYAATLKRDGMAFNFVQRFIVMPMMLFSGTYFPLSTMPTYLQWIGWISPVWHGTQLARWASYGLREPAWLVVVHVLVLVTMAVVGAALSCRFYTRRLTR
ncbi:ABC transporter permease [Aestuariimicrobium ganziense]|uniref:ABC transporter permease n=1 Tax=Aestuariimicrobium ganziense TaxID=2773677 RepID=UPI001F2A3AAA|nr:ABC transporter permease [Aestuariimicrobium ganziense]